MSLGYLESQNSIRVMQVPCTPVYDILDIRGLHLTDTIKKLQNGLYLRVKSH